MVETGGDTVLSDILDVANNSDCILRFKSLETQDKVRVKSHAEACLMVKEISDSTEKKFVLLPFSNVSPCTKRTNVFKHFHVPVP